MCQRMQLPDGGFAIVCGGHSQKRCKCGARATLECDWKMPRKRSGTCDVGICARCATSPAPGKDLCAAHAAAYQDWLDQKARAVGVGLITQLPASPASPTGVTSDVR